MHLGHTGGMRFYWALLAVAVAILVAGLVVLLISGDETGEWFVYGSIGESPSPIFLLASSRMVGIALLVSGTVLATGVAGYWLGQRTR